MPRWLPIEEMERHHAEEFSVTASAPMAGPYNVSGYLDGYHAR